MGWIYHLKNGSRPSLSALVAASDGVLRPKVYSNPFLLRFLKQEWEGGDSTALFLLHG